MITFRFYVVSMAALFLALALGVVIGSALDEDIVDTLNNRVTTVNVRLDSLEADNDELRAATERDAAVLAAASPHMVDGVLEDRPVLLVAERGMDPDLVQDLQQLVVASGAASPGILWLEQTWTLADEDARAELAAALDVTVAEPAVLRGRAWHLLAEQLTVPTVPPAPAAVEPPATAPVAPAPTTTAVAGSPATTVAPPTTTTIAPPPTTAVPLIDALTALGAGGLITFEPLGEDGPALDSLVGHEVTVLVVTGPGGDLEGTGFLVDVVQVQAELGVPTVLVAVATTGDDEDPDGGEVLRSVRSDDVLTERVSTVDHVHLPEGRAAAVLAAADLARAVVGHYGELADADRVLPVWAAAQPLSE